MPTDRLYVFSRHAGEPVPVGQMLVDRNGHGFFRYSADWQARDDAFPLDPEHLPLGRARDHVFERPAGARSPVFNALLDAGPDDWGRNLLRQRHPHRTLSDLEVLSYSSGEGVGCLLFSHSRNTMKTPAEPQTFESLVAAQEGVDRLVAGEAVSRQVLELLEPGSSLGGARPKITVQREGALWIAKFPKQSDAFDVPRVELAMMALARKAGIDVPETDSFQLPDGRAIFLVQRFDRFNSHARHFISARTMLGADRLRPDDLLGDISYAGIANRLRRHGDPSRVDKGAEEIYRRMAFNVMCNNTDDHLRNHGYLWNGNAFDIAPAYDIVPQLDTHHIHAIGIGRLGNRQQTGRLGTVEEVLHEAGRFGITADRATTICNDVADALRDWRNVMARHGVKEGHLRLLEPSFELVPNQLDAD